MRVEERLRKLEGARHQHGQGVLILVTNAGRNPGDITGVTLGDEIMRRAAGEAVASFEERVQARFLAPGLVAIGFMQYRQEVCRA